METHTRTHLQALIRLQVKLQSRKTQRRLFLLSSVFWQKTSRWLDPSACAVYYNTVGTNVIVTQSMPTGAVTYKPAFRHIRREQTDAVPARPSAAFPTCSCDELELFTSGIQQIEISADFEPKCNQMRIQIQRKYKATTSVLKPDIISSQQPDIKCKLLTMTRGKLSDSNLAYEKKKINSCGRGLRGARLW